MQEIAEDTSKTVKDSNDLIRDTKLGQEVGAALEIMSDPTKAPTIRMASAETAMLKGKEDRVPLYVGLPAPSWKPTMIERKLVRSTVELPNVSLIGEKVDADLSIAPVSEDLFQIEAMAVTNLLTKVLYTASVPGVEVAKLTQMREALERMVYLAPAVVGGMKVEELKAQITHNEANRDVPLSRTYRVELVHREKIANALLDSLKVLSMSEEMIHIAKLNIESRLLSAQPIVVRR